MPITHSEIRVSPQPIRNRRSGVAAFELLHRRGDAEMSFSSRVEALPTHQVVLEILESVQVDERVICRCVDLRRRGFHDVSDRREEYTPMLQLADIVKADLPSLNDENLEALVSELRRFPLQLPAEKVDSVQCVQRCIDLQFDLFQGYYFDPPVPAPAWS